jgi:hypothetical protein
MRKSLLSLTLCIALAACATNEVAGPYYESPSPSSSCILSHIAGTRNVNSFPVADHTLFVASVDGLNIRQAEARFNTPIPLCSTTHKLSVAWSNGSGKPDYAILFLEAKANRDYLVKHKVADKNLVRVWIEDKSTSSQVGEAVFIQLVPTPRSTVIPIIIPR